MTKANLSKTKKGGAGYFYSIIGVALVLLLLGILGWIFINAKAISDAFKESVQVSVIFNDNTDDAKGLELKKILEGQNFTKTIEYVSKEQAAEEWVKANGEKFNEVIDFNPLYASINVHLKSNYIQKDSLLLIQKFILQSNIVREVDVQNNLVDLMNAKIRKVGIVLLVVTILLVLLVILLIDNTIKLAMYSNRFLIKTMQFVGATRWFITKPFNQRALINGLISGTLAVIGVMIIRGWAETLMPELRSVNKQSMMWGLYAGIVILGILISLFSTTRSVRKYLKTSLDDLY